MKTKSTTRPRDRKIQRLALPVFWEDLPHEQLWQKAQGAMLYGSIDRSKEDAVRHVLRPRLQKGSPDNHRQYIELECIRLVEQLRRVRDVYRDHLAEVGHRLTLRAASAIFQLAVQQKAHLVLQEIMVRYLMDSRIEMDSWRMLFAVNARVDTTPEGPALEVHHMAEIDKTIQSLLDTQVLAATGVGGPFGREAQRELLRARPWSAVRVGGKARRGTLAQRLKVWDSCESWTEGLSRLFDCCRAELFSQFKLLATEAVSEAPPQGNRVDIAQVAYEHLVQKRQGKIARRNLSGEEWVALLKELDRQGLQLEDELQGRAREVLMSLRQKGKKIDTWEETFEFKSAVVIDNRSANSLRREVMHSLHNAAKRAEYHFNQRRVSK